MHVSLTAEPITHIGPLTVTNSLFTTWLVIGVIAIFAVIFKLRIKKNPTGVQNLIEAIIEGFYGVVAGVAENPKLTRKFFAPIFTIFLFVLLNNWAGLIPGVGSIGITHGDAHAAEGDSHAVHAEELESSIVDTAHSTEAVDSHSEAEASSISHEVSEAIIHAEEVAEEGVSSIEHAAESVTIVDVHELEHPEAIESHVKEEIHSEEGHHTALTPIFRPGSADLSFTLALAIAAVLMVQYMGVRELGAWGYFSRFLNFSNPVHFFVGILEIISEFSKMVSFSFRLFGNIFAGEVLLTVIIALAPFVAPMPFYGLEIFVGAVQALVFAMLTLVFFRMATTEAH